MKKASLFKRQRELLLARWSEEDCPGGTPRFQLGLHAKDLIVFCLIPILAILFYKLVETSLSNDTKPKERKRTGSKDYVTEKHSQIIQFQSPSGARVAGPVFAKRAPGTIVRVRLMNVVETFSNVPVHVQIIDGALGQDFMGATMIGNASPEVESGRITINFSFVRHPRRLDIAVSISGRAMSLYGTFGLSTTKKEGLFARASIRSATNSATSGDAGSDKGDFKTLVARAVAAGLMQEFQNEATTAHNKAQVLTLKPMTEFFVELTDYFPGQK